MGSDGMKFVESFVKIGTGVPAIFNFYLWQNSKWWNCLNENKYLLLIKSLYSQIMLDKNCQNSKEVTKVK
jgi:hypothetical protein